MNTSENNAPHPDDTGTFDTASQAIMIYLAAFEAMDADTITTLLGDNALLEVPLLKPNRLFGESEIRRGHEAAFGRMKSAKFEETHPVEEKEGNAICFGDLVLEFKNGERQRHQTGIVAEVTRNGLKRISIYFNSRNIRRWADETIV